MFVLDEADEMLNRGFKDQIYDIFRNMNSDTQVLNRDQCIGELARDITSVFWLAETSHVSYISVQTTQ